jgi:hypothetical protein
MTDDLLDPGRINGHHQIATRLEDVAKQQGHAGVMVHVSFKAIRTGLWNRDGRSAAKIRT